MLSFVHLLVATTTDSLTCDNVKAVYRTSGCCGQPGTRPVDASCAAIDALDNVAHFTDEWQDLYVDGVAYQKAFRDFTLASPHYQTNGASPLSFLRAAGTNSRRMRGIEYNFGQYEINIVSPLTGNFYDILIRTDDAAVNPIISNNFFDLDGVTGTLVQTMPVGATGRATFRHDHTTRDPVPWSVSTAWNGSAYVSLTDLDLGELSGNFVVPSNTTYYGQAHCLVAYKAAVEVAKSVSNVGNGLWIAMPSLGAGDISTSMTPFFDGYNTMNVTKISGTYYHPRYNVMTHSSRKVTTLHVRAKPLDPLSLEVARTVTEETLPGHVNSEQEVLVESMTIKLG